LPIRIRKNILILKIFFIIFNNINKHSNHHFELAKNNEIFKPLIKMVLTSRSS
jgi:hypothetical protein